MLIIVIEPFGMVEDEVAVDQVVEHERALLEVALVFKLVFDLDVVILALIDPGELAGGVIGVAQLFANAPSLADILERGRLDDRDDLADRVDQAQAA